mmetsp:Transcript_14469/g.35960  ORF Transcript_14469/g.35960 Transcript_14469/m.35960 type:complete len:296 (-) Transcript_14469:35-922(-)
MSAGQPSLSLCSYTLHRPPRHTMFASRLKGPMQPPCTCLAGSTPRQVPCLCDCVAGSPSSLHRASCSQGLESLSTKANQHQPHETRQYIHTAVSVATPGCALRREHARRAAQHRALMGGSAASLPPAAYCLPRHPSHSAHPPITPATPPPCLSLCSHHEACAQPMNLGTHRYLPPRHRVQREAPPKRMILGHSQGRGGTVFVYAVKTQNSCHHHAPTAQAAGCVRQPAVTTHSSCSCPVACSRSAPPCHGPRCKPVPPHSQRTRPLIATRPAARPGSSAQRTAAAPPAHPGWPGR